MQDTLLEYYEYIWLQDRDGLLYPSNGCVQLTILALDVFGAIVNDIEMKAKFLSAHSAENVFCKVFCEVAGADTELGRVECSKGHKVTDSVVPSVARALFHVFSKNVISKANSMQHGYSGKRSAGNEGNASTRSQANYKRQKLDSTKKSA